MSSKKTFVTAIGLALAAISLPSQAEFFALGEESSGASIKGKNDSDIKVRVRIQPRLDVGDLFVDAAGRNVSESDLYIRRARLEAAGNVGAPLKYKFVVHADKANKDGTSTSAHLKYALVDYKFADAASLLFGKTKLPYSRVSLTSSSQQLLVERPASTEAAKKLFGDYNQPILMLHGKAGDMFSYAVAAGDGVNEGPSTSGTTTTQRESDPYYGARIVISPMPEGKQSDAHLGAGQHLSIGLHAGIQNGQGNVGSSTVTDRELMGADVSFHMMGLTAQAEYNKWTVSTTGAADVEPEGMYVQVGYFIPGVNIEPAVRYEEYDHNSNAANRKDKITTAGFNYYLKGHSAKLGLNYVSSKLGSGNFTAGGDDTRDVIQLQTQLYF